jgi:hypothetical protein
MTHHHTRVNVCGLGCCAYWPSCCTRWLGAGPGLSGPARCAAIIAPRAQQERGAAPVGSAAGAAFTPQKMGLLDARRCGYATGIASYLVLAKRSGPEEALLWSAAPPFFEAPPLSEGRGRGNGAWAGRVAVAGRWQSFLGSPSSSRLLRMVCVWE